MPSILRVAALQMVSQDDVQYNLNQLTLLVEQAAQSGAQLLVLPENFALFSAEKARAFAEEKAEMVLSILSGLCQKHGVWICAGTLPFLRNDEQQLVQNSRVRAACFLLNDQGVCVSRYDKVHLFDVTVNDAVGCYRESKNIEPGNKVCVYESPWGKFGFAVCYDLRFPEMFRIIAKKGALLTFVPSAFTRITGLAHWEVLLRARAIENQMFIIGANQGGTHHLIKNNVKETRDTFGGSSIVSPWGVVLNKIDQGTGIVMSDLNFDELHEIRKNFPVFEHAIF